MCGIAGILNVNSNPIPNLRNSLEVMSQLLIHRGPDGFGTWFDDRKKVGLVHRRLSIIDLNPRAAQPFKKNGLVITYNGEIYNYKELKQSLNQIWDFTTESDTEVILALYAKYGVDCVHHLRGMFAFAIWDEKEQRLFCARDRFGIKPFYYLHKDHHFIFASEIKAILPFLDNIQTNTSALLEYLTFQYSMGSETLFSAIHQLLPAHALVIQNGKIKIWRYWDVNYEINFDLKPAFIEEKLNHLLSESVSYHQVSDVPVGAYLSGGIDSTLITSLARDINPNFYGAFHGRFTDVPGYDESTYADAASSFLNIPLFKTEITPQDFIQSISDIIYHLDVPVAGPGAFPQYMVSKMAAQHVKVVLAGQGGDEIFGGYARYLIAYFEQCIKAAIDGTYKNGNFVVTPESIIPNLTLLQEYKPLLRKFWNDGLFGPLDERYFRLIDRSLDFQGEIQWEYFLGNVSSEINVYSSEDNFYKRDLMQKFKAIFNNQDNVRKEAYFDKMTHFDFKCSLPALLHVEDRMSMAHGLESRVPFLDHSLVEFAATIPADIKFPGGKMKHLLKTTFESKIPGLILNRRDKMGFPVPLKEWLSGPLKEFVFDIFSSQSSKTRPFFNSQRLRYALEHDETFSRKCWGLLSLELWHQIFIDKHEHYKSLLKQDIQTSIVEGG